ncbi:hypothetical protein BCR33DRAFT_710870 [Rhizoclosmatium globosum]|uniref:Uncharacterized protein n=1 Tax=Rhizoclosmatium globosum TaxID=329046 RepID=A0A1Y2D2B9_9FUNG|nr:hypothetical protein BCR33DRAFT_710870 [Rhizoclosmatium globosum]|eukprot:ORY53439.1 hypothetical protein BCR33DRAFT_710870 [Rhizoclosmatium globosum]
MFRTHKNLKKDKNNTGSYASICQIRRMEFREEVVNIRQDLKREQRVRSWEC